MASFRRKQLGVLGAFFLVVQVVAVTVAGVGAADAATAGPIVASHSGLCLQAEGGSSDINTRIVQVNCDGSENQSFEMRDAGGGLVDLYNRGTEHCLHVRNASTEAAAEVLQYPCTGTPNSLFTVDQVAGGLRITVQHTAMCLDIFGASRDAGATLIQWPCHGNANQVFDWQSADVGGGGGDTGGDTGTGGGDGGGTGTCTTALTVEAETGSLGGAMTVGSDGAASGGQYVHTPQGSGNDWSGLSASSASYCFNITSAGDYRIETKAQGLDGQSDSFFVAVDGQPTDGYLFDIGVSGAFGTRNVSDRGGANPVVVNLSAGDHTISFHNREDASRLDSITLVPLGGNTGGGGGGGGGDGTGACVSTLSVEAETGALSGFMAVGSDGAASGGQYVHVPNGIVNEWGGAGSANTASYCFSVANAGEYRIETSTRGLDGQSDSFYVTVDGQPAGGYLFDIGASGSYTTRNVSDRGGANPVLVDLTAGEHTITFHNREDGSRLDTVTLVPTNGGNTGGGGGGVNTTGSWGPVVNVGLVPVAMANVPNGEVLMWSAYEEMTFGGTNGYTETVIYNPDNGALRARRVGNTQHDMFCPGIANMPDGRVIVTGGSGNAEASIYNPATDSWEDAADMNIGRGYHANVTLSDGSVLAVGGSWSGGVRVKDSEIFRNGAWTTLPGIKGGGTLLTADYQRQYRSDNHMWLFSWKNNQVFHAGPAKTMHWLNPAGQGSVQALSTRGADSDAMNGNAVMYDEGKILTSGGAPDYIRGQASGNTHIIDLNAGGAVRQVQGMSRPRALHSSVVLPSGEVVALGGQSAIELFTDSNAVMVPELFNPDTETWSQLAPMSVPRTYHSAGLLLHDGRVMVGGGGLCGNCAGFPERNHPDIQILTPPYLLDAAGNLKPRPVINSAPGSAGYGQSVTVNVSGGASEFALVRLANSTHSNNNAQRRLPVSFTSNGGGSYQVTMPSDAGVAPPGAYMLFALDANGTPSVSKSVMLD